MMSKVQIVLSTYNGEKYVEEQIESLLSQTYSNIHILIRDDGSVDKTRGILKRYSQYRNVSILLGENKGVIPSFFELLEEASDEAEYIAFCDQDDYWKGDKIEAAIRSLKEQEEGMPALYCSRVELVNEELKHIGMYPLRKRGPSFENAVVQNIATGCTIVMNQAARKLILKRIPRYQNVIMHDWWFYLVVSAFGTVIYDSTSRMLYRQHQANTVGADHTLIGRWVTRFKRYVKKKEHGFITRQAAEFMRLYGDMLDERNRKILSEFLDSRKTLQGRIQYFFTGKVHRQSWTEDIVCRLVLLFNIV